MLAGKKLTVVNFEISLNVQRNEVLVAAAELGEVPATTLTEPTSPVPGHQIHEPALILPLHERYRMTLKRPCVTDWETLLRIQNTFVFAISAQFNRSSR